MYDNDEDEIEREKLSSLIGATIVDMIDGPSGCVYLINARGAAFACLQRDGIFDPRGNLFVDDI